MGKLKEIIQKHTGNVSEYLCKDLQKEFVIIPRETIEYARDKNNIDNQIVPRESLHMEDWNLLVTKYHLYNWLLNYNGVDDETL